MYCVRCGRDSISLKMSWFNTDMICPVCQDRENRSDLIRKAKERELAECKAGNMNYQGIYAKNVFAAFRVGYVYCSDDKRIQIRVTKRTDDYVYFESNVSLTSRSKIKLCEFGECIRIKTLDNISIRAINIV